MRTSATILALVLALFSGIALATACPNQSTSVTIQMTGETLVTVYDSTTCNQLAGPFTVGIPGSALGAATKPGFTTDSSGVIHFVPNGAPFGTRLQGSITFFPDPTKSMPLTIVVGGAVSGLVAGTTTP